MSRLLKKDDILSELLSCSRDDDVSPSSSKSNSSEREILENKIMSVADESQKSDSDCKLASSKNFNESDSESYSSDSIWTPTIKKIKREKLEHKTTSVLDKSQKSDPDFKLLSDSESYSSEDNWTRTKKKTSGGNRLLRKFAIEGTENAFAEMTSVEVERQKNVEERMRIFKELALKEAKEAMLQVNRIPKKSRVIQQEASTSFESRQKSSRIQAQIKEKSKKMVYAETVLSRRDLYKSHAMSDLIFTPFNNADFTQYFENLNDKLNSEINMQSCDMDLSKSSIEDFETKLQSLKLRDEQNMKLLPSGITALKFHPSDSAMLIGAGGKSGSIGLWNVNVEAGDWDDSNIMVFQLHTLQVNCVSFSNFDSSTMYTSSYDGILYKGDLNKKIFEPIYVTEGRRMKSQLYYHCEQNAYTLFAAQDNGVVSKIDVREKMGSQSQFRLHHDTVRTISIIPQSNNLMVTCSDDATVSMWDLRYMSKQGMYGRLWNLRMDRGVASAFLSPVSGNRILITLPCNTFCIYDTQSNATPFRSWQVQPKGHIHTKPSNYPLKATWHPQREDFFSVARTCAPYGVEVYRCNYSMESLSGPRQSVIMETLKSALTEFHPSYPAVATSCTSNVHLFL